MLLPKAHTVLFPRTAGAPKVSLSASWRLRIPLKRHLTPRSTVISLFPLSRWSYGYARWTAANSTSRHLIQEMGSYLSRACVFTACLSPFMPDK